MVLAKDFKGGQLPTGPRRLTGPQGAQGPKGDKGDKGDLGPTFADQSTVSTSLIPVAPADVIKHTRGILLPSSGRVLAYGLYEGDIDCTAGTASVGLYIDGNPVAGSRRPLPTGVASVVPMGPVLVNNVTAGERTFTVGLSCDTGNVADSVGDGYVGVVLLAG